MTDDDKYLDTAAVLRAANEVLRIVPFRHASLQYIIKEHGRDLEEDEAVYEKHIKPDVTLVQDYDMVRNAGLSYVQNRYHNWIATLDLVQALLQ